MLFGSTSFVKRGRVVWFNVAERYGFLTQEDGASLGSKDLFFHLNNGLIPEMTYCREDLTIICNPPMTGKSIKLPNVGDEILYQIGSGSKGPVAAYWVYHSDYERVSQMIQNQPIYRVVHKYYDKTSSVRWCGIWPSFCPIDIYNHDKHKNPQITEHWSFERYWQTKLYGDSKEKWIRCNYPLSYE